jgi:hypothetical protein
MRRHFTTFAGGLAAAALLAGAAAPANARRYGPPPPPRHHHHDDNTGDVIGTIAAVGIVAAVVAAVASSNARKAEQRRADPPPPPEPGYADYDAPAYRDAPAGPAYDDGRRSGSAEDGAVDACVLAARDRATVDVGFAEIRGVTSVQARGGGWDVAGTLVARENYRALGQLRDFRCSFQDGRVDSVTLQ